MRGALARGRAWLSGVSKGFRNDFAGHLDLLSDSEVRGWACDQRRLGKPVSVEILVNGRVAGTVLADNFRPDLLAAGIGDGHHGFEFRFDNPPPAASVFARVKGSIWPLADDSPGWQRQRSVLANSLARGLPALEVGVTKASVGEDDLRIATEMQALWCRMKDQREANSGAEPTNMWTSRIRRHHAKFKRLLAGSDTMALAAFCVSVQKTEMADGLMQGRDAYEAFASASAGGLVHGHLAVQDALLSLAIHLGVVREECPEQGRLGENIRLPQTYLREQIERKLGHSIVPPPIFDGLYGLAFPDGVLHGRDIHAAYAVARAFAAVRTPRPNLCEIGAGFGRAAYFAVLRNVGRYMLVDTPTVALLQYLTLRRSLPSHRVTLLLRDDSLPSEAGIDIVLAEDFVARDTAFDLVLNCDSFPEMGPDVGGGYLRSIAEKAPLLLSINQEAAEPMTGGFSHRQCVVGDLAADAGFERLHRFRSWVRKGYVEELFQCRRGAA